MEKVKPVRQPILFNKIQLFTLKCLLEESCCNEELENKKLLEYINKYSKSFRDLWLEYENKDSNV